MQTEVSTLIGSDKFSEVKLNQDNLIYSMRNYLQFIDEFS